MSKITAAQVIAEAESRGAKYVCVTAAVWNESHALNNSVSIYVEPEQYFRGNTLEEAFALYMAQFTIGTPAEETVNEIAQ